MDNDTSLITETDLRLLRLAIALSARAGERGNAPFGAVLADRQGNVLLKAENTQLTERDATGHAELNLIRLASPHLDPATFATRTLYTSSEPCQYAPGRS